MYLGYLLTNLFMRRYMHQLASSSLPSCALLFYQLYLRMQFQRKFNCYGESDFYQSLLLEVFFWRMKRALVLKIKEG